MLENQVYLSISRLYSPLGVSWLVPELQVRIYHRTRTQLRLGLPLMLPRPRPKHCFGLMILEGWLDSYSVSGETYIWFESIFYFENRDFTFIIQGGIKLQ